MSYPIPGNEIERLATLNDYRILDTGFDRRFDNLAEMAAAHFGMPIALVSLVDADRQWFKAKLGIEARQTPRQHAFCTHTIARPDAVTVVEDALLDPRFVANPLVTGAPYVRFYAGAPILAEDGVALGTVSVADRVPRTFGPDDRRMLARLADNAQSLLELHRRNSLLRETAGRDALTGLATRRGLDQALERAVSGALAGETCGVLCLDVDRFKLINERHGPDLADGLIQELARRLQASVRQGDLVARVGGDEFVILLAHPVNATVLDLVAQRVLAGAALPILVQDQVIDLSISVGGAQAPRDAVQPADLLREADRALYSAKRAGGRKVVLAGEAGVVDVGGAAGTELARAIERGELFLEWQSGHDLVTGEVKGYEALVRWNHPRRGVIAPLNFVPLAEACGLSGQLDAWVLYRACEEAAQAADPVRISVNLSAQWMAQGHVVPLVRSALERSGLAPQRLILEVTEGTAITHGQDALDHMRQLKALGIQLALDDFGTGYSSLAYLQRYPFDILKLDQSFVAGLDPRGIRLLQGVIHLADLLDIAVIAEGIETPEQADIVRAAGCRTGQGYLWARPRPMPWADAVAASPAPAGQTPG